MGSTKSLPINMKNNPIKMRIFLSSNLLHSGPTLAYRITHMTPVEAIKIPNLTTVSSSVQPNWSMHIGVPSLEIDNVTLLGIQLVPLLWMIKLNSFLFFNAQESGKIIPTVISYAYVSIRTKLKT